MSFLPEVTACNGSEAIGRCTDAGAATHLQTGPIADDADAAGHNRMPAVVTPTG
jgi:hypothetical protein